MRKFFKYFIIFLLGGALVPSLADWLLPDIFSKKQWVIQEPNGTKHRMPERIQSSKDCDAYIKWRDSLAKPGFAPSIHPCPWNRASGGVGTYSVNGVTFKIPQNAFLTKHKEGENQSLHLLLRWPDLTPASWGEDQSKVINVSIYPNHDYTGRIEGLTGKLDHADWIYHSRAWWLKGSHEDGYKIENPDPILVRMFEASSLGIYLLPRSNSPHVWGRDFYIKGSPLYPEYWYMCHTNNPRSRCETTLTINDKVYINISHRREFFMKQKRFEEVMTRASQKIRQFIHP